MKTRYFSGSILSKYLGSGQELITSEVPTLRAVLRKALLVQEEFVREQDGDKRSLPVKEIMKVTCKEVMDQVVKSNCEFSPPVILTPLALQIRLEKAWNKFTLIANGRASKAVKSQWQPKLDKLLDLTLCHCTITVFSGPSNICQGSQLGTGHITYTCPRSMRLPKKDLAWLHGQRNKVGEYSNMAISGGD